MMRSGHWRPLRKAICWAALAMASATTAIAQSGETSSTLLGVNCDAPPAWHCPDTGCERGVITQPGDTVELLTRRTYFLDCPSGYQPGDKVNLVLSLHGFGSYANWQRNYAPFFDSKDENKLVVITPGSPVRFWSPADDEFLHNIIDQVVASVGKENVGSFIMAGHSQGGMTSRRLVCTDYFRDKVDVRISLSGGRVGPTTPAGRGFADGGPPVWKQDPDNPQPPPPGFRMPRTEDGPPGGDCDYSFIFTNGEYESLPGEDSPLAEKYSCEARAREEDVLDPKAGYVWDAGRQDPGTDGWGRYPRSGRAQVYIYPKCDDGRVIADVVRLQKGHTEGLEPNVTRKLVELALSASGGKIANGDWEPPELPSGPGSPFAR